MSADIREYNTTAVGQALHGMREHDAPTYALRGDLITALLRTDVSKVDVPTLKWAHPSMMFCLPSNHPDLKFLALNNNDNTIYETGIETITITLVDEQRVVISLLSAHSEIYWVWGGVEGDLASWINRVLNENPQGAESIQGEQDMIQTAVRLVIALMLAWQSVRSNGDRCLDIGCNWTKSEGGKQTKRRSTAILVSIAQQRNSSAAGYPTGAKVILHWTRGHFRQQPHGEGRTLTKTIWIEPYHSGSLTTTP